MPLLQKDSPPKSFLKNFLQSVKAAWQWSCLQQLFADPLYSFAGGDPGKGANVIPSEGFPEWYGILYQPPELWAGALTT